MSTAWIPPTLAEGAASTRTLELARAVERIGRVSGAIWGLLEVEVGVSRIQAATLEAISGGARQVREVAEACDQHVSSASRMVDALVTDGLVTRDTDPADRRAVVLGLTADGEAVAASIVTFHAAMLERILADLSDEEVSDLARLMTRFAASAETATQTSTNSV